MQKINTPRSHLRIIALLVDILALSYMVVYFYWIFFVENMDTSIWTGFFAKVNPMTWGTYFMGLAVIIHFASFRNVIGRCLMAVLYAFSVLVSLVAIMGMFSGWDFVIYVPHIIIIILIVAILKREQKRSSR